MTRGHYSLFSSSSSSLGRRGFSFHSERPPPPCSPQHKNMIFCTFFCACPPSLRGESSLPKMGSAEVKVDIFFAGTRKKTGAFLPSFCRCKKPPLPQHFGHMPRFDTFLPLFLLLISREIYWAFACWSNIITGCEKKGKYPLIIIMKPPLSPRAKNRIFFLSRLTSFP